MLPNPCLLLKPLLIFGILYCALTSAWSLGLSCFPYYVFEYSLPLILISLLSLSELSNKLSHVDKGILDVNRIDRFEFECIGMFPSMRGVLTCQLGIQIDPVYCMCRFAQNNNPGRT